MHPLLERIYKLDRDIWRTIYDKEDAHTGVVSKAKPSRFPVGHPQAGRFAREDKNFYERCLPCVSKAWSDEAREAAAEARRAKAGGGGGRAGKPGHYFDTFSGLVPVRFHGIKQGQYGERTAHVEVSRDHGPYKRGEMLETHPTHVVPKEAVSRRKYGTYIRSHPPLEKAWSDEAREAAAEARRANAKGNVVFNVNPKTGPTKEQKEYAAREMYGTKGPKSREDWYRAGAEGRAQMERIWGPTKPGTQPYQHQRSTGLMMNQPKAYREAGHKAGEARRHGDEASAGFHREWFGRAIRLEDGEGARTARREYEAGYQEGRGSVPFKPFR